MPHLMGPILTEKQSLRVGPSGGAREQVYDILSLWLHCRCD
jgi:hypothetical protein